MNIGFPVVAGPLKPGVREEWGECVGRVAFTEFSPRPTWTALKPATPCPICGGRLAMSTTQPNGQHGRSVGIQGDMLAIDPLPPGMVALCCSNKACAVPFFVPEESLQARAMERSA